MKVYTKTGDQGLTSLLSGQRLPKDSLRVETYGTVDEASSSMGLAKALLKDETLVRILHQVQEELIGLSADLATESAAPLAQRITTEHVQRLEQYIDSLEKERSARSSRFVVPGQCPAAAALDLARTVVRRTERLAVKLSSQSPVSQEIIIYLNRLSDLLYVAARRTEEEDLVKLVKDRIMSVLRERIEPNFIVDERGGMLALAKLMLEKAEMKARELGVPMVMAVVDDGGNLVAQRRMDGALLVSISLALDKAYTAAALKIPTEKLAALTQPGQALYGLNTTDRGRLVVFGGGLPIWSGDQLIGAIGVSGGSVEQDIVVAEAALAPHIQ